MKKTSNGKSEQALTKALCNTWYQNQVVLQLSLKAIVNVRSCHNRHKFR